MICSIKDKAVNFYSSRDSQTSVCSEIGSVIKHELKTCTRKIKFDTSSYVHIMDVQVNH